MSACDLDGTTRFSVLIMSARHGATVKEVQPPKRGALSRPQPLPRTKQPDRRVPGEQVFD